MYHVKFFGSSRLAKGTTSLTGTVKSLKAAGSDQPSEMSFMQIQLEQRRFVMRGCTSWQMKKQLQGL
jgi:hypothetical protein